MLALGCVQPARIVRVELSRIVTVKLTVFTPIWDILRMSLGVICGQKSKLTWWCHTWSIFLTLYYFETTGVPLHLRHSNVSRDVIVGELFRNKYKFSRKPGNWVSVICGQKIHTRMGMSGSVICGQKIHSKYFYWVSTFFEEKLVWEVSQRHLWTKNPDNFLRMTNWFVRYCGLLNIGSENPHMG